MKLRARYILFVSLVVAGDARAEPSAQREPPSEYGAVATASRLARPVEPVPASVTVLTRDEIDKNPTLTSDSLLRSVPSALTFRRSSSLSADPSSQGLNLRGVAPSGVSRTLVLLDGVPVNDPFAGSVYYRALPRLGLERIEIVPGGGSAMYGSAALSGVVQLFSRSTRERSLDADASYGLANTLALGARAAGGSRQLSASLEADWLSSDGFHVVHARDRGPIDAPQGTYHGTLRTRVDLLAERHLKLSLGLSYFREELSGSTRFTSAAAALGTGSLHAEYDARARGRWNMLVFGRVAEFEQERARVAEGRVSEQRAARQFVPGYDQGGSLSWSSKRQQDRPTLLFGIDARHVSGGSHERIYPAATPGTPRRRDVSGQQALLGAFAELLQTLHPRLLASAALRADWFRNYDALGRERADGQLEESKLESTSWQALSPRVGLLLTLRDWLKLRASGYRSFRAPTLNELYRPFQVGTVLTAANPGLAPEYLTGAELGFESVSFDALTVRATGFWNVLDDPIINATLAEPLENGAQRQRRNLQQALVRGAELQVDVRLDRQLAILLAYTYVDARVSKQGAIADLKGKQLAQDPAHRASAQLLFDAPRWLSAALSLRILGRQFEDDLNTLPMKPYAVVDVLLSRTVWRSLQAFVAVENLLNQSYLVGRAGVDTTGTPLLARAGLRVRHSN